MHSIEYITLERVYQMLSPVARTPPQEKSPRQEKHMEPKIVNSEHPTRNTIMCIEKAKCKKDLKGMIVDFTGYQHSFGI
jgi:hypothetical protein